MTNGKISVVINTLNEEKNIVDCINSASDLADEVVICDMYSDDRTVEIAERLGAHVVHYQRTGYVEPARHFAISQAIHEWILVLDADERMTPPLAEKLREVVRDGASDVVNFWSLFWYFGDWVKYGKFFSGTWPRFFRKKVYLDTYDPSEEYIHWNFRRLKQHSRVMQLPSDYYILHLAYPTIEKYVCKTMGIYARIEAEQLLQRGQKFSVLRLLVEPAKEIVKRFFLNKGYKDGTRGLILTILYAGYRFATWANLWLLEELCIREFSMLDEEEIHG